MDEREAALPRGTRPSRPPSLVRSALSGIAAGVLATLAMSGLMVAAERLGLMGQHPPSRIAGRLLRLPWPASSDDADRAGAALHYATGGALGLAYALLRRLVPPMRLPGAGIAYGLGVWAVSYAGVLPALRLMPPPHRDRPGRQPAMVAGHVVFGLALGLLVRAAGRTGHRAR